MYIVVDYPSEDMLAMNKSTILANYLPKTLSSVSIICFGTRGKHGAFACFSNVHGVNEVLATKKNEDKK